jgi:hypothetical protein
VQFHTSFWRFFGLPLLFATLAVSISALDRSPQLPFSITISAEKPDVKTGSEAYLKVRMKNISDHEVDCTRVPTNGWDGAYQYDVRDSHGNLAERILPVPGHPEIKDTSSIWPCILKPSESTNDDHIISRLYDLSHPGKYVIQVLRLINGGHKEDGVVKSNTITITVTP